MKNKGFTLIELLAVIVVLSIIVIIAIPNVIEAFNKAKKKTFVNDVQTLSQTARGQYRLDKSDPTIKMGRNITYCSSKDLDGYKDECNKALTLKTGGKGVDYYIAVDKNGEVIAMYVTNYVYDFTCDSVDTCKEVTAHEIAEG